MAWIVLMLVSWISAILLVRKPGIGKLWPAGFAAVAVTLLADITLVRLGAYQFNHAIYGIRGVPLLYIISNFANGMLLTRFVPEENGIFKALFTAALAVLFLFLEYIMMQLGYFTHLNWSFWHSLALNIIGFMAILWFADLLNLRHKAMI